MGGEETLKEEMATHPSILVGKIPWTEESGELPTMGSQRVGLDYTHGHVHTHHKNIRLKYRLKTQTTHCPIQKLNVYESIV